MTKCDFLGEQIVDVKDTPYKDYTSSDWAMFFISSYGQTDGAHHKLWVLDQVARILKGTKVILKQASWSNSYKEYRISLDQPSDKYQDWVISMLGDSVDGEYEYSYDEGIAP